VRFNKSGVVHRAFHRVFHHAVHRLDLTGEPGGKNLALETTKVS
jgi:hypothetical protein